MFIIVERSQEVQVVLKAVNLRLLPALLSGVERGDSHMWVLCLLSTVHLGPTYAALSEFSVQDHVSALPESPTGVSLTVQCSMRTLIQCSMRTAGEPAKEHRILGFTLTPHWGLWGLPGP